MNKIKRLKVLFFIAAVVLMVCGCSDVNGKLNTKREVLKKVEEVVPAEGYKLVSVEHDTKSRPKVDTYYFASTERNLSFTAVSSLRQVYIDGPTGFYTKSISVNYEDAVHDYYRDEIDRIFEGIPEDQWGNYRCGLFSDLKGIAEAIAKADDVFKRENNYNSQAWLKENYYGALTLAHDDGEGKPVKFFMIRLDGTLQEEFVYDYLTYCYAEAVKEERFADESVPEKQLARVKKKCLDSVWVNWEDVSFNSMLQAKEENQINRLDSAFKAYYFYDWDSYVVLLDCGLTDDTYAPQWMKAYADALGLDIKIEQKKGRISWTRDGEKWVMETKEGWDNHISSFTVTKNGKDQNIRFIRNFDDRSPGFPSYVVAVSADDFAKMFGLEYDTDEEKSRLWFYSDELAYIKTFQQEGTNL